VLRFERVKDVLATGTYPTVAMKYISSIEDVAPTPNWDTAAARPKGIMDESGCYIERIGEYDNMRTMLKNVWGASGGSNSSPPPKEPSAEAPTESTSGVDGDDE
jgi:hypothetical protein